MTSEEQVRSVPYHKTTLDLIKTIVESYVFLDFGKIVNIKSSTLVDIEVGIKYSEQVFIAENIELLAFGGNTAGSVSIEPDNGSIVLLFGLRSYAKELASPDVEKPNTLKYANSNLKAILFSPASSSSATKIVMKKDGTVEITATKVTVNGMTDSVVLHSQLNTALSAFITALNTALASKANGSGTPGSLTLNISSAASQSLKVGS